MTVAEHPALDQPAVLEVIPQHQADAAVQATREKLQALQTHVDTLATDVAELEARMRAQGATPEAAIDASERLDAVVAQLHLDATAYAQRVITAARLDAEALVAEARRRADFAAVPFAVPVPVPVPQTAPPPPPPVPVPPALPSPLPPPPLPQPATTPAARGLEELTWVTVGPVHVEEYLGFDDDGDPSQDRRAFARTIGLLQVVLWSVLIAAGLIVGLAWFA